ncbi:MAG: hypothetical protein ACRCZQ_06775 [Bacteroidales bacterium]
MILIQGCVLFAQNEKEHNAFISEEISEYECMEEQNELLIDLELNPIDLNNSSRQVLERSGLFSSEQIENLLFYLYVYGEMKSIYELKMVKSMDYNTIQKILPYVIVQPKHKDKKAYLNQSINISFKNYLTKPDGFINRNDSLLRINKKYIGDPSYLGLVYEGKYGNNLQWGIALEKDAGEQLYMLPDYSSFYFQYRSSDKSLLKQIIIGSFKLRFANGLIMNNTYETGYSSLHSFQLKDNQVIRKHNSFSESDYHKGVAVSFEKKNINLLLYGSSNNIDATLQDSFITSISKSGKHNTFSTLERRKNENINSIGGTIGYKTHVFDLGVNSVMNIFSRPIHVRNESLANRFYFQGNKSFAFSCNWSYKNKLLKIFGEEAYSNKGIALLNCILLQPDNECLISFAQRYFSPEFYSFYGRVFGNSNIRNEEGYYCYVSTYTWFGFYFSANIDYYRTLWAVSGSDFPKDGFDIRIKLENRKLNRLNLSFLYKYSNREKEIEDDIQSGYLLNKDYRTSYSFRASYEYSRQFLSQTLVEYSLINNKAVNRGFHLSQIFTWQSFNSKYKIQSITSVFDGEEGVSFYSPVRHSLYTATGERISGKGYKFHLNVSYIINAGLTAHFSYSYLQKNNVFAIGSGLDQINGNNRQIYAVVIRYNLK